MIRNRYNQIPHPALKTKREITKYTDSSLRKALAVNRMKSSFLKRWSFSYLKFTKYVINIIAEPKYKYGLQEQVTVRNHNRSTALERSVLKYRGLNPVLWAPNLEPPRSSHDLCRKCSEVSYNSSRAWLLLSSSAIKVQLSQE